MKHMRDILSGTRRTLARIRARDVVPVVAVAAGFVLLSTDAFAGTEGAEFDGLYDIIVGWMQGTLGRIIALVAILVGLAAGAFRQNYMAAVGGVVLGLALFFAPGIIGTFMTATLPVI